MGDRKKSATVDLDRIASELAPEVSQQLLRVAKLGCNEADFRREAARIFEEATSVAQLTILPRDEFSVACGRVDSVYNRLILEYKRPGIIRPTNTGTSNLNVIQQIKAYINDVATRHRREVQRLAGVATDGLHFIFVRKVGEGWSVDDPVPVNKVSTEKFLRLLFSLSTGAALVPENLVEDFGPQNFRSRRAVMALYRALHSSKHPLVQKLFEQWRMFFSEATDYKEWAENIESKEEFQSFIRGMGLDPRYAEAPKVFFALHSYYALLIKLVASLAAARFAGETSTPLVEFSGKEGNDLKEAFAELERGGLFRQYGIRNFLEGDFFGWYITAWDHDIEDATGDLVQRLAEYDPGTLELAPENARDLLKKLYHYLLPREVRHDLGEYYTPDWLAERLIIQTVSSADLGDPTKRVLDPACGSGTFLVILIKYIRQRTEKRNKNQKETLRLILQNIVGMDLNPLAVIAARTNYLLALGDLLKSRDGDIDIPVYQADSVLAPSQGQDLFEGDVYPLRTSAGQFRIPAIFAERERMEVLANVLDESVESRTSEAAFLTQLSKASKLEPDQLGSAREDLRVLFKQLRDLHDHGVNGVWARIIKNAFAPVFLEQCHYVIGNPPWVNWEHLPDEYRRSTMPLWVHYGLFPHGGMDTILGKGKKDISMLMTYVSVDKYLKRGGKLGFVLSQSLFKTSGAGQGFRRFLLPDKTLFFPSNVEDMVHLNPFEGAANRTAVAIFAKGRGIHYPVPYSYWKKRQEGRGSTIGFDTPYEEVAQNKITYFKWHAEPVDTDDATSPWLTARLSAIKALRKFVGPSAYSAIEGSNTGGANAIYWMEIIGHRPGGLNIISNIIEGARRRVPRVQAAVEVGLVYPLLRGRDVSRWAASPSCHILMAQDPETRRGIATKMMESRYPKTHAYLSRFETILRTRPAFRRYFRADDAYWSMFNVSAITFSEWKVVWREQASRLTAAVVGQQDGRPIVPDHKLMMVGVDSSEEAHFLCGILNSAPVRLVVAAYAIEIQISTHILENVGIPKFNRRDPIHSLLSKLSKQAHHHVANGNLPELELIEKQINLASARVWKLSEKDLNEIERSLDEV